MIFVYPNTVSTFTGNRDIALSSGYIEIDKETYADLIETKKKWENGEIVDDPTYAERMVLNKRKLEVNEKKDRIAELRSALASLDYHTLKHVDGQMTDEEYEPIKQQKIAYREEINALEAEIQEMII